MSGWLGGLIDVSAEAMTGFGVDLFAILLFILVADTVIALEIALVSCTMDLRAGVAVDVWASTVIKVASVIGVDASAGMNARMWGPTTTVLESIPMLASIAEVLSFGWKACSCSANIALSCSASQA